MQIAISHCLASSFDSGPLAHVLRPATQPASGHGLQLEPLFRAAAALLIDVPVTSLSLCTHPC